MDLWLASLVHQVWEERKGNGKQLHSRKLTWQWKIIIYHRSHLTMQSIQLMVQPAVHPWDASTLIINRPTLSPKISIQYCWWLCNPGSTQQLRERSWKSHYVQGCSTIPGGWEWDFWTINLITLIYHQDSPRENPRLLRSSNKKMMAVGGRGECSEPRSNTSFWWYMGVSKNRGTPKWIVYNGKPY